jgi:SsrA-binding protein
MSKPLPSPPAIRNKKAGFNFELLDKLECGIALTGSEVKSLRRGKASLEEAFCRIDDGELFLRDCNISPYENAGYAQHEPARPRRLLAHRREIIKLHQKVTQRGFTLVPLRMYFNDRGIVKVQIALARGKATHDKRADLKQKDQEREIRRAMKHYG